MIEEHSCENGINVVEEVTNHDACNINNPDPEKLVEQTVSSAEEKVYTEEVVELSEVKEDNNDVKWNMKIKNVGPTFFHCMLPSPLCAIFLG